MSSSLTLDAVDALVEGTTTVHVCALFQPLWPSTHGPSATFSPVAGSSAVNAGWGWLARRATWDIVRPAGEDGARVSAEGVDGPLRAFIASGRPPVYVGFGSMPTGDPDRLLCELVAALDRTGVRGVIGSGLAGLGRTPPAGGSDRLPDSVIVVGSVPHDWLFPSCAAVVHHGGAGTTAAARRAGVHQVVVPHIADQPYWGRRVHALGVGPAPVARKDLTVERLVAALEEALADETRSAAYRLGERIRGEDGVGDAARLLAPQVAHRQMRVARCVP